MGAISKDTNKWPNGEIRYYLPEDHEFRRFITAAIVQINMSNSFHVRRTIQEILLYSHVISEEPTLLL